jgi:hypothetical protein
MWNPSLQIKNPVHPSPQNICPFVPESPNASFPDDVPHLNIPVVAAQIVQTRDAASKPTPEHNPHIPNQRNASCTAVHPATTHATTPRSLPYAPQINHDSNANALQNLCPSFFSFLQSVGPFRVAATLLNRSAWNITAPLNCTGGANDTTTLFSMRSARGLLEERDGFIFPGGTHFSFPTISTLRMRFLRS